MELWGARGGLSKAEDSAWIEQKALGNMSFPGSGDPAMTKYTTQEPTPETWKALLSVLEPKNRMSQKPKEKPPNKLFSDILIIKTHGGKVFVRCSFSLVFAKFGFR